MNVAVLAIQGAFVEHENMLRRLGVTCVELRGASDLRKPFDALVLPGGESTVQGKLLRELGMSDDIKQRIADGMPVLATCAGLILLADRVVNDPRTYLRTLPIVVRRNAYGRQLGSFRTLGDVHGIDAHGKGAFPMEFIRAPYVEEVGDDVEVLAKIDTHVVAVRYHNQVATAFHPELTGDTRVHELFLDMIEK